MRLDSREKHGGSMIWQDIALAVTSLIFIPSLIPLVIKTGTPRKTSIPTALALTVIASVQLTLDLYFAAGTAYSTALLWWIIAYRGDSTGNYN